ncbi:MAG: HAMP domain-containing methyl-accepting chemotaxis protein [Coriobacteriales bacterium]|nr:HAMP domain-containing methyl-accepting chemotaxis protein [Coriobacteriales bacterium]
MAKSSGTTVAGRLNRISLLVGVCFVLSVGVALIVIAMLSNSITSFIDDEYQVMSTLGTITRGNQGTGRNLSKMILAAHENDQVSVEEYYEECKEYFVYMQSGLETLTRLESKSFDKSEAEQALSNIEGASQAVTDIHKLCVEGKASEAWKLYQTGYVPKVIAIRSVNDSIRDAINASAAEDIRTKDTITAIAFVSTIGIGVVLLAILVLLTRRTARTITEPVEEIEEASERLRHGDLNVHIRYNGNDELGMLCKNFNESCQILSTYVAEIAAFTQAIDRGKLNYHSNMEFLGDFKPIGESLEHLSQVLSEDMQKIASSAEQVYSGAEQMSSVGTQLSQSAVEQASSVQELLATINTVSNHVMDNATTALEVRDSTNALYESMSQYGLLMQDVNRNMLETRSMTDKVRGIVRNLETISFQTNTLALNAAVEAARAGDAGRGFAVIAGEIRELASEASKAATNTSVLLGDMVARISTTTDMSQHAIGSLDAILADGNTTNVNVDKISNATKNQAVAIEQVRHSIGELSENIKSISSTAEETAASAEELQGQMKLLNAMVDSFDTGKGLA